MSPTLQPCYLPEASGLYCCLQAPTQPARTGVLFVQPLFGEYIQHHRAFFGLAERLARSGLPCLRYDHHGTGDSRGDLLDAFISRWLADVEVMAAALVRMTGVDRLVIVGARFGAALALGAAARIVRTAGLVLWEPVWSGRAFLDALRETHRRVLTPYTQADGDATNQETDAGAPLDLLGFEIPGRLVREMEAFEPDTAWITPDMDVFLIGSDESVQSGDRFYGHDRVFTQSVTYPRDWLAPENGMYDVLVPTEALNHIARWIESRR